MTAFTWMTFVFLAHTNGFIADPMCAQGTCYKGHFSAEDHAMMGRYLEGFSFRNISSVPGPQTCLSACSSDCRCRAFQMTGTTCELLEEDRDSMPARFGPNSNYSYFDLHLEVFSNVQLATCSNYCCLEQQCLNNGTCAEHCDDPKEKFSCLCSSFYSFCRGRRCEKCFYKSCLQTLQHSKALGEAAIDGVYSLRTDAGIEFSAYCAFNGTIAWTLIESFAYKHRKLFFDKDFRVNMPFNVTSPPSWQKYRLSRAMMVHVRINATLVKADCGNDNKANIPQWPKDLAVGKISEIDIIYQIPISLTCRNFVFLKIRGHSCYTSCSVGVFHGADHIHMDTTVNSACTFKPPDASHSEDSFGFYQGARNPASSCMATGESTTQWWLGHELNP